MNYLIYAVVSCLFFSGSMKVKTNDEVLISGRRCDQRTLHFCQKSVKAISRGSYLVRILGIRRRCLLPLDFNPSSEHGDSVSELLAERSVPAMYSELYKSFPVVILKDEKDVSISSSLLTGGEAASGVM